MPHAKPEDVFLELSFGEQMLLWGIRIWVTSYKNDLDTQNLLNLAYSHAGVPRAHVALDTMMEIITTNGYGVMDIRCPSCINISADEMRLIAAIAAWQNGSSPNDGDIFLEFWVKPAALRIMRPIARMLAKELKDGGLLIRPRALMHSSLLLSRQNTGNKMQSVTIH